MASIKTRILVVDDHALLRTALRLLINQQHDMQVTGEASSGTEAVTKAFSLQPDLIVMDLGMPEMGGIEATKQIHSGSPTIKILILSMHDNPEYLRAAVDSGASGYVLKSISASGLLATMRSICRGHRIFDLSTTEEPACGDQSANCRRPQMADSLSPREFQVLQLIACGYSCQKIANSLSLSLKTVESYRRRMAEKLGLKTRADFVRYAFDRNVVHASMITFLST